MSSYYISFINYLDKLGSLLKSVHKMIGILARNKKYANFLVIGRHGDGALSFYFKFIQFKASIKYRVRE